MRLGFVYAAHGVIHSEWKPRQTGRQYELPPNLQPLARVRDHFNILTNLSHLEADSKGDGSGDHNRAAAAWLTGVHAYDRTRPGAEIRLAESADQIAAQAPGQGQPRALHRDDARPGDAGGVRFRRLLLREHRLVAQRDLAQHARDPPARDLRAPVRRRRQRRAAAGPHRKEGSLLDSVLEETRALTARLGRSDTSKLRDTWIRSAKSSSAFRMRNPASRSRSNCPTVPSAFPPASRSTPS